MERYRKMLLFIACIMTLFLTACGAADKYKNLDENKITVIATLFPQYDFARQIAGDYANVVLLLPPGMESHSYDPSPADMIAIQNSDIFLYTEPYMESWAADVIEGIEGDTCVVDLSVHVPLVKEEDIEAEYESVHAEHGHEHEHSHAHSHDHTYDPHIWTNPVYAEIMVEDIAEALIERDPVHAAEYVKNKERYLSELQSLDADIRDTVAQAKL